MTPMEVAPIEMALPLMIVQGLRGEMMTPMPVWMMATMMMALMSAMVVEIMFKTEITVTMMKTTAVVVTKS